MPAGIARADLDPPYRHRASTNNLYAVPADLGPILSTQWSSRHLRRRTGSARLGAAILREAWFALRAPRISPIYQAAYAFFFAPADPTAPVSLELACLLAEIDPEHVRRAIRGRLEAGRQNR